jgi:hypothetical protein
VRECRKQNRLIKIQPFYPRYALRTSPATAFPVTDLNAVYFMINKHVYHKIIFFVLTKLGRSMPILTSLLPFFEYGKLCSTSIF